MIYETIILEPFYVTGIVVRTSNQNGQSQKDIGELWQKFYSEQIIGRIPDKVSDDVYCIYTDYENDVNGAYTTILGCKVSSLNNVPKGMSGIAIPEAAYRLYRSRGKLPDSVLGTWMHIWQAPVERKYAADFDVYGTAAQNPDNAEVETYLSVRL
jgi:predicted transcriptional regulator YdeE